MKKAIKEIISTLVYLLAVLIFTMLIVKFVIQRTTVSGPSMMPTLVEGDSLMINKISLRFGDPERFDIITFPFELQHETLIKRVIGLPGETVQILSDGTITINGEALTEDVYGKEVVRENNRGIAAEPLTLGPDEYFVMGDNRNNSMDSRNPLIGPVKRNIIIGKAWIRIWPFSKFGKI